MAEKRLFKEFGQLNKVPASQNNPQIITLQPKDPENIFEWEATICKPSKSHSPYYYKGQWNLDISVTSQYPIQPPKIKFDRKTPICHPNINIETGEICLDILKSENWSPAWNLEHLVGAILMLIDDPEPDSPLNIDSANLFRSDKIGFESFVQFTIWKYNTFYEDVKETSGVKSTEDIVNVEESTDVQDNRDIIKDVGKQVTQDFINKVDEIKHSKNNSLDSNSTYDDAKRQIVENVNKQVNELCSKSVSPVSGDENDIPNKIDTTIETESTAVDPIMEEEKIKFLKEIDKKVNAFNNDTASVTASVSTSSTKSSKKKSKRERLKAIIKK
ncbi:hypothetical protein CLIB1444_12S03950 [[Candida] jaroonii]|uniref:Uncharacterized protein n=1 Tax=[Candida] jaroonii TaxID=467808 RepID=A0ACA9YDV5_9ASCO|nr:hypothetical protein CLIB1444_12S03950 [[Candida] jaroonii]